MTGRKMEVLSWRTPPHVLAIESMTAHSSIAQLCIFSRTLGGGWHNFDAKMHIFQQEVPRFRCGDLRMKLLMWSQYSHGTSGLPGKKWQQIAFAHEFPAPPAFLTSVQTLNNAETWLTVPQQWMK